MRLGRGRILPRTHPQFPEPRSTDRDVLEIDHGWCHSIYTKDPNENLVEFCLTTGAFTAADRAAAIAALTASVPAFSKPPPRIEMHRASANTRRV